MTEAAARPTLFLIAGPNGAGKTVFYETVLKGRVDAPFINADEIQRDELRDKTMEAAYKAAEIASARRAQYLEARMSFITETVFSHPSKLAMLKAAQEAGYRTVVFHLNVASADLAVARVAERVEEGGHPVPEEKIRARYYRNQKLIRAAALMADFASIYDASRLNHAPRLILKLRSGRLERQASDSSAWCEALYGDLGWP